MQNKLIFLGGGNMAEAIFAKLTSMYSNIVVIQRNQSKLERLTKIYPSIIVAPNLNFIPDTNDIVFIGVKPQDAKELCSVNQDKLSNCIIVSLMAGIGINTLQNWLHNQRIVRIMSNTPAMIGIGVSGMYCKSSVDVEIENKIMQIMKQTGLVQKLNTEDDINKITAIAASSPAYLFYFLENMLNVAVNQFNFDAVQARQIILQVARGSIALIENNPQLSLGELRAKVTSKKGTTQAACEVFDQYNLAKIIAEAEEACYNRAIAISNEFK